MLVLFETPAGFAIFKVLKEAKLSKPADLWESFSSFDRANDTVQLIDFRKFKDTTEALANSTALIEGKMSKQLSSFLKKWVVKKSKGDVLGVGDSKLAGSIKEKLGISCSTDESVKELLRGIRSQIESLITGMPDGDLRAMNLGLAHSLSRYKLKFSPDKVDTMIVQAIGLLDDLDKELNVCSMRAREWYGLHFPECSKIISDNVAFAKCVLEMKMRPNIQSTDLSDILTEELEEEVKKSAEISMGSDISQEGFRLFMSQVEINVLVTDMENICFLCDQIVNLGEYRQQLYEYLKNRMNAIAPNLTIMVGELVGARLIAHAGSLLNLAKHPASTVQILGAEKALFRALKAKSDTPKYGLIYHASLIGQSAPKNKGKISRILAAKTALSIRVDAMGSNDTGSVGLGYRTQVESRISQLEGRPVKISGLGKSLGQIKKYEPIKTAVTYNEAYDITIEPPKKRIKEVDNSMIPVQKKKKKEVVEENSNLSIDKKKKKKNKETDLSVDTKRKKKNKEKKSKKSKE